MNRGIFVAFYGINNLGKTLQAKRLVKTMQKKGFNFKYIKYAIYKLKPSGTILNNYLRESNRHKLSAKEFQLIHIINRTQYQPFLQNMLGEGVNIVAEDYLGTGIAWGAGAGVDKDFLIFMNSHLIQPDLSFCFYGKRFETGIEKNHKHESDNDLTDRVQKIHLELAEEFNWHLIDANRKVEVVQQEILKIFLEKFNKLKEEERTKNKIHDFLNSERMDQF